jgi:hypothetical protein
MKFVRPSALTARGPRTAMAAACLLGAAALLASPGRAAAGPALTCELAEADAVDVDGMLDDWAGVKKARAGGTDGDASFDVRCLFDGARLLLAVDVRDEHVVRARGKGGDDRLELSLAAGGAPMVVSLEPGVDGIAPRRKLGGKAAPKWLAIEDTLQERGWSAEVAVPLAKLAGWGPAIPVTLSVNLADADVAKIATSERTVAWSGELALGAGSVADPFAVQWSYDRFLREAGISAADVTIDTTAELDGASKGPERFLAGGDVIALMSDHFSFVHLPVERPADVLKVELVDLRGDGSRLVAVQLRQRGGDGARDLLTLWSGAGDQLHQVGMIEIGKERGAARLKSAWTIEPAKKWKQAKGAKKVLVVRSKPAVGWDEDSYGEATSVDAVPIHVPWDDDRTGGVFWLDRGDTLQSAVIQKR